MAAPIDASVGANVLSAGSSAGGGRCRRRDPPGHHRRRDRHRHAGQRHRPGWRGRAGGAPRDAVPRADHVGAGALDGNLLNVNVDLDGDLHLAAPIDGAVAANANVAAPIDAAVSANIGSVDSGAVAVAHQTALIDQNINGDATATADQRRPSISSRYDPRRGGR